MKTQATRRQARRKKAKTASGRAPKAPMLKILYATRDRLASGVTTDADRSLLITLVGRITRDEDVRDMFFEQVDPRPAATSAKRARIALLDAFYEKCRPEDLEKMRTSRVADALLEKESEVRRARREHGVQARSQVQIAPDCLLADELLLQQLLDATSKK